MRWKRGVILCWRPGENSGSLGQRGKSTTGKVPQPGESEAQGIFPLKLPFGYPQPAPAQPSCGTKDDCKPVVMEMSVALRSARALGSPQTHFRFRRLAPITMILPSTQGSHEGNPPIASQALAAALLTAGMRQIDALKFWNTHRFPISSFFMPIKSAVFKCHSCFLLCTNLNYRRGYVRTLTFSGCFKVLLPYSSHPRNAFLMENRFYFLILYVDFVHWSPLWYRVITTISPVLS